MPKPYPPESLEFLEFLCRVAPGMGRPCSHEGRMLLQTPLGRRPLKRVLMMKHHEPNQRTDNRQIEDVG